MGNVVFLWPHADVADLMGSSHRRGQLEPHHSPAQRFDMMDTAGSWITD